MVAKLDEAAKDYKLVVLPSESDMRDMAMGTLACPCSVLPTTCFYRQVTIFCILNYVSKVELSLYTKGSILLSFWIMLRGSVRSR